jgi:dTDP-4-dehydrorhamnose reductase
MERILITGGSGLLALNWAITVRDRYEVLLVLHNKSIAVRGVESRYHDLESLGSVGKMLEIYQPDLVVNTVSMTNVDRCEAEPELAWRANVLTAENLAVACCRSDIRLIHISTDHLFDNTEGLAEEESPFKLCNVYARTKAEAEARVLWALPEALVLRTNFYGWGTSYRQSFSDFVLAALRANERLILFRDVMYTPIVAELLIGAAHDLFSRRAHGIYHLVGDDGLSKYDFGLALAAEFGLNQSLILAGTIEDMPHLTKRPRDMRLSNKKVSNFLGYELAGTSAHLKTLRNQQPQTAAELAAL